MIKSETLTITTTGSAGAATGSATSTSIIGELLAVWLNFHASAPATTDTTVAGATTGLAVLTVTNSATDAIIAPALAPVTTANVAITNAHRTIAVNDRITVSLAQSDALTGALVCTLVWRP